jgi:hypothetical protein
MNVEQLEKQLNKMVRLRPPAQSKRSVGDWIPVDWDWRVSAINKAKGRVEFQGHNYCLTLMSDHIKEFMHDSHSESEGFLILKVQVFITGDNISLEPLSRQL